MGMTPNMGEGDNQRGPEDLLYCMTPNGPPNDRNSSGKNGPRTTHKRKSRWQYQFPTTQARIDLNQPHNGGVGHVNRAPGAFSTA